MPVTLRSAGPPGIDTMGAILAACGIDLTAAQRRRLWMYHCLLREHNPELNLTRIHNFGNMVLKLYADSILPARLMQLPSPLMDLGSGPGMPGIPLKIYHPQIEVVLAETRGSRVDFLNRAIGRLGLKKIRVVSGRITPRFEEPMAGVITRAVETIAKTLERVAGCLDREGLAIFMKGPHCDAEVEEACRRFAGAYALLSDQPYRIPTTPHARRLVVFRRLDESPARRRARAMEGRMVRAISSDQNPLFKELKRLLTGRGIRRAGRALVSGEKQVAEVLAAHPRLCLAWVSGPEQPPPETAAALEWYQLAPDLLKEVDLFGTHAALLLIRLPEISPWAPADGFPPGASVLIPFQDPENVGAAIRSAAAFGAAQAILLAESAHPFHPKALRSSGGAVLSLPLRQGPSLEEIPPDLPIVALSAEGGDIRRAHFPAAFGLLAGMEGPGLPAAWRRGAVRIPIRPEVESLNAAAATAVALYEWRRRVS